MLSLARAVALCSFLCVGSLLAQNPGTGLYANGTFDTHGFDTINMGNLNTHFEIPIVTKAGRGLPFNYSIVYDGLVWSQATSSGTAQWIPDPGFGFHGQLNGGAVVGFMTSAFQSVRCGGPIQQGGPAPTYGRSQSKFVYHDPNGKNHHVDYQVSADCGSGPVPSGTGATFDGSGYTYDGSLVHATNGNSIAPNLSSSSSGGSITDANGNFISSDGSGNYTDTTGTVELKFTGGGTASSPLQLTYPVTEQANGTTSATANIYYKAYTVQTTFSCGIGDYPATSKDLVDHITLANGDTYSFTYEATANGVAGAVTGRLGSITLPTGGNISYALYGGTNGIVCSDGTPPGLNRVSGDGSKTYNRGGVSGNPNAYTTVVTDERGKQTYYAFSVDSSGLYEATHRRAHDGTFSNNNLLEEDIICYNNAAQSNGTCEGQAITQPITEVDTSTAFNYIASPSLTKNTYDTSGNLLTNQQASGTSLEITTSNAYTQPGSTTELASTKSADNAGNIISYTGYGYDETSTSATSGLPQHNAPSSSPGNQTSVHVSIDGGTTNTLTTTTAYYVTGMPASTTAPGNFTTSYGYDSTGTFQQSTGLPTPSSQVALNASAQYDPASGSLLSITGLNQHQTFSATQYDALLRPRIATTPEGGQSTSGYTPNQISSTTKMNSSQTKDTETFLDGYGRVIRTAVQSSSGWYLTDSCYMNGVLQAKSTPYLSSSSNPSSTNCSGSNATQYTFDGLGRITQVATPDGHSVTATYNGRAVQVVDSNGTNRIVQTDLLGRTRGVCEVNAYTNLPGGSQDQNSNCGFDIGGTGLLTSYGYNPAAHTVNTVQGSQGRTFVTDAAGRTTSVTEPESGTATYSYSYNINGLVTTRVRGRANQNGATQTTTQTYYDSIGRLIDVIYNDGTLGKHYVYDQGVQNGLVSDSGPGAKGQLTGMATIVPNNGPVVSALGYVYDIMGRVTFVNACPTDWCTPSLPGSHQGYGYDLASEMTSHSYATGENGAGYANLTYSYNTAGQMTSISGGRNNSTNQPTIWSATTSTMQPGGPQFTTNGNNTTTWTNYDAMDRFAGKWVCGLPGGYNCPNNSQYYYGMAQLQVGQQVKWQVDTVMNRWTQFNYDQFGNLAGSSPMPNSGYQALNFSASYDRYGNRWSESVSNTPPGSGPNQSLSFNTANNQVPYYTYDAVGNLTNDNVNTYQYDAESNLIAINNGSTASYTYNALNQRDKVVTSAGTDRFTFDQQGRRFANWQDGNAYIKEEQFYGDQGAVAFFSVADAIIHFAHDDATGTQRMRTDNVGSPPSSPATAKFASLPFGEVNGSSGSDLDPSHFAWLDQDGTFSASSLGLQHATFREYNSIQGRWMSPDPYSGSYDETNPQSLNRYSYVMNNPLGYTDPTGQCGIVAAGTVNVTPSGTTYTTTDTYDYTGCPPPWWLGEYGAPNGYSVLNQSGGNGVAGIPPYASVPIAPNNGPTCTGTGNAPPPSYYAQKGQAASSNAVKDFLNLFNFRRGGALDAQVGPGPNGQPFGGTPSYANYTFGVYMSAAGYTLNQTLAGADIYAQYRSRYPAGTPMGGPNYPFTPQTNINNITNGFNAQTNGTTCHKPG